MSTAERAATLTLSLHELALHLRLAETLSFSGSSEHAIHHFSTRTPNGSREVSRMMVPDICRPAGVFQLCMKPWGVARRRASDQYACRAVPHSLSAGFTPPPKTRRR